MLLHGPSGVGKTLASRCIASALTKSPHDSLELDCADAGVDEIRDVTSRWCFYPSSSSVRVTCLKHVDQLSTASLNALLKPLEELKSHNLVVLTTTRLDRILPTIRSRCSQVEFAKLKTSTLFSKLHPLSDDKVKVRVAAKLSDGNFPLATKLLVEGKLGMRDEVLSLLKRGKFDLDTSRLLGTIEDSELLVFLLNRVLQDLLLISLEGPYVDTDLVNEDVAAELKSVATVVGFRRLVKLLHGVDSLRQLPDSIPVKFHLRTVLANALS